MDTFSQGDATEKQRMALVKLGIYAHPGAIPEHFSKGEASKRIDEALAAPRNSNERLSLATIRALDPNGGRGSSHGRHYLCPFAVCSGHKNTRTHRSLSVSDSGQYFCHRCHSKGILAGCGANQLRTSIRDIRADRLRAEAQRSFQPALDPERQVALDKILAECIPLANTPGEAYLRSRGIVSDAPSDSGVMYHPSWYGIGDAIVFLSKDERGKIVGAQGRYIDQAISPKVRGAGRTSAGIFMTRKALDLSTRVLAITEAPIDALSIVEASGVPAIALFGVAIPAWLRRRISLKHALIATDNDEAGESCASRLKEDLALCVSTQRLQWPDKKKDANEFSLHDRDAFRIAINDHSRRLI